MDKYLLEATLRYDGSMNFAPGKRWGLFPSFSAGWVMSEEKFYEPIKSVMNFFKLKGSWGMIDATMWVHTNTCLYIHSILMPLMFWEKLCAGHL